MSGAPTLALIALLIALALWVVLARGMFAAVAGFIAYGLLLTLAWVGLSAVDVAMTEAAIGGGLTGALLIGAASRLRGAGYGEVGARRGPLTRVLAVAVSVGVTAVLVVCLNWLPEPQPTLVPDVAANLDATGVGNPITGVLLAFRAMDTLLEAIVLLFALIGVWSLTPDAAWGQRPDVAHDVDPDGVLAYVARVLPPIGVVIAIYILWVGADAPGGKFQGATVLAAMWLLAMMAGLARAPLIGRASLRAWLVAGPLVFVAIGVYGVWRAGAFLAYPDGFAKPLIVVIEIALMPSLAITLALLLAGAPRDTGGRHE
ncbi:hydrogenase subunit MbhD domain-containing protein [Lysobacter sp. FW306-1B-D06B]|uniref:hydrogenase subunit MbhD domain-containing protein n=1 Tax=Lysobacter sp. FW306-1B-D06B TaxID=3140250 RepID=UPI003140B49E